VLLFDEDAAGRKGRSEARERLSRHVAVSVIRLNDGQQADSLAADELLAGSMNSVRRGVRGHPAVCFAVVRGISDLTENKQEADLTGSHAIAARNAAAFAFEMLAGRLRGRASSRDEERPLID
jgi:hypothetical protein